MFRQSRFVKRIRIVFFVSLVLIASTAAWRAWNQPCGAHIHRQIDTMGMTVSLVGDWKSGGISAFVESLFYPKILQRGLSSGLNVSEFPFLSAVLAPFFRIFDFFTASFLSSCLLFLFNLLAGTFLLSRLVCYWKARLSLLEAGAIYFSLASIEMQSLTIMPESFSFPLFLWGTVIFLESIRKITQMKTRARRRDLIARLEKYSAFFVSPVFGLFVIGLSLSMKPTMVFGLLSFLLLPKGLRLRALCFAPLALILPVWWYKFHSETIRQLLDGSQIFAQINIDPLGKLSELGFGGVFSLLWRQLNEGQLPFMTGLIWIPLLFVFEPLFLALIIIGLFGVMMVDGTHLYAHAYYFFGVSFISLIAMARVYTKLRSSWLKVVVVCTFLIGNIYAIRRNVWNSALAHQPREIVDKVTALIETTIQNRDCMKESATCDPVVFVTDDEMYPRKLLFIERAGSMKDISALAVCLEPWFEKKDVFLIVGKLQESDLCFASYDVLGSFSNEYETWFVLRKKEKIVLLSNEVQL